MRASTSPRRRRFLSCRRATPRPCGRCQSALGLDPLVAETLVRRGFADPAAAEQFLAGGEHSRPARVARGRRRRRRDRRARAKTARASPCTATTTSTASARPRFSFARSPRLGADVTWHVPSRFDDGYGLSNAAIDKLAGDGAGLIVAVDCGITAVDEVAHAKANGRDRS